MGLASWYEAKVTPGQLSCALAGASFAVEALGEGYRRKTPRFAGWMDWGVAHKQQ